MKVVTKDVIMVVLMVVVLDVMSVVVTVDCVFGNTGETSSRNIVRLRGITSALHVRSAS